MKKVKIEGDECLVLMKFHRLSDKLSTGQLWIMFIKTLSDGRNITKSMFISYPQNLCTKSPNLWTTVE